MSNGSFWKLSTDKEAGASAAAGGERLEMPTEQPSQKGCTVEVCASVGHSGVVCQVGNGGSRRQSDPEQLEEGRRLWTIP